MYGYEEFFAEVRSYLADFSENGFSQTRFDEFSKIIAGKKSAFQAVIETFDCNKIELAASLSALRF